MKRDLNGRTYDTTDAVKIGRGVHMDGFRQQHITADLFRTRDGVYFGIEKTEQFLRTRTGGTRTLTSREWYLPRDAEGARRFAEVHGVDLVRDIV